MNWVWTIWLIAIVVSFGSFEAWALAHNKTTLSRYVWTISKAWPPFPWLAGVITGFLACHFWWGGAVCFAPVTQLGWTLLAEIPSKFPPM